MKKNYAFVAALLLGVQVQAQQTIDFESHPLSAESYDNGSGGAGDFAFTDLTFTNFYDTAWGGYWEGFSISNITDNVTAGFGNQYSAYPGMGSGNSSAYSIYYLNGQISGIPGAFQLAIDSLKITNCTYTAISMRDGDAFAKKFGSPNDASGSPDGTNGEDFLRVWIIGEDDGGGQKDSVEFYLADYRFADSTQDYIVDEWVNIDLTGFGFQVHHVNFRFESSDNGAWGMNTPAYFAVDDVTYEWILSVDENKMNLIEVYPNPATNKVNVKGREGILTLMSLSGELILKNQHSGWSEFEVSSLQSGIYIITLENDYGVSARKLVIK